MSRNTATKQKLRKTYHAYYPQDAVRTSLLAKLRRDFRNTESSLVKNYIATLITFVRERKKTADQHETKKL